MEGFPKWLAFQTLNSQLDLKFLFSKSWKCYFDEKIPFGPDKILPSKFQVRGIPQCHQQCKLKIETNGLANWHRSIWASLSDSASWYQHLRPVIDGMGLNRSLFSLPQCQPLFGPLQVFLIRWSQGYGIINSATKPQVVIRILIISIEAMNIKCSCKVFTCVLWKVSPLNLHFVVSARMFSLEMSWRCCYTWLQAALPLCNLRVLRHEALTPAPWRLRSSQFMFLANIKQSPNIGFRILFSSGPW